MFAHASLRDGFIAPQLKLAVLPEHRLLRRRRAERPAGPGPIASFTDLRAGSPVVHEDHGIALFTGFETKTVGGVTRDYLELEYRDGDRVFVPSDQLHKISRYVGADAGDPPLSKLGGKQWEQMKLQGPPRRAGARGRADQPLRRAEAARRPRLPARQRVAARVRGPFPVPRDARPARGHRGRARRHGGGASDGPADLRRRGLRQDRGGAARGLQGGRGRQAGDVPRAHHRPRPAALRHLPGAPARLPVPHRDGVPLPLAEGRAGVAGGLPRGEGRHPDRHAQGPVPGRAAEGTRAS